MRYRTLLIVALLAGVAASASADILAVDNGLAVKQSNGAPSRGMTKDQVAGKFGAPSSKTAAVGKPPISRWEYSDFVVYFEYDHVIHTVVSETSPATSTGAASEPGAASQPSGAAESGAASESGAAGAPAAPITTATPVAPATQAAPSTPPAPPAPPAPIAPIAPPAPIDPVEAQPPAGRSASAPAAPQAPASQDDDSPVP